MVQKFSLVQFLDKVFDAFPSRPWLKSRLLVLFWCRQPCATHSFLHAVRGRLASYFYFRGWLVLSTRLRTSGISLGSTVLVVVQRQVPWSG